MSDELSNSAKLAILKYLVAIFVGGFSIFSVGVYFAAIEPLKNLESRTEKSVDRARNIADKNQEKLEKLFNDFVIERDNIRTQSTVIKEKIKDANQVMGCVESSLRLYPSLII